MTTDTTEAAPAEFTPTAEAKKQATTLRIISWVLWIVAIALELVAIFWLLRQRVPVGEDGLVRNEDTGLLEAQNVTYEFPQWAFITLIVAFVVIGALSIIGSQLWKKANRLDPAKRSETFRFFVQNQLGAIVAIIAFLPLIIVVLLNKDMSGTQNDFVRADMVFFETGNGGAVFSTGSIAWAGAMAWNGYDNEVSLLMRNVVRRFDSTARFGKPETEG